MTGIFTAEVWSVEPARFRPWHLGLLDGAERSRAARYRREADRRRFVVGAALLRLVVGRRLQTAPALVPVDRSCRRCGGPHGQPRVRGSGISLSVAHSAERVMLALSGDGGVGVDVEQVHAIDADPLARLVLSEVELAQPGGGPGFFPTWVRKEAVLKSIGTGLDVPMTSVVLGGADAGGQRAATLAHLPGVRVLVADLDAGTGYAAALAALPEAGSTPRGRDAGPAAVEVHVHRDETAALLDQPTGR
jgi:4'-phosphopantetheinyl transferase